MASSMNLEIVQISLHLELSIRGTIQFIVRKGSSIEGCGTVVHNLVYSSFNAKIVAYPVY